MSHFYMLCKLFPSVLYHARVDTHQGEKLYSYNQYNFTVTCSKSVTIHFFMMRRNSFTKLKLLFGLLTLLASAKYIHLISSILVNLACCVM